MLLHVLTYSLQVTSCVRLGAVAELALEVFANAGLNSSSPIGHNESTRIILEGLLAHFFSPERRCYNSEDIHWFLDLANSQRSSANGQVEMTLVLDEKEVGHIVLLTCCMYYSCMYFKFILYIEFNVISLYPKIKARGLMWPKNHVL